MVGCEGGGAMGLNYSITSSIQHAHNVVNLLALAKEGCSNARQRSETSLVRLRKRHSCSRLPSECCRRHVTAPLLRGRTSKRQGAIRRLWYLEPAGKVLPSASPSCRRIRRGVSVDRSTSAERGVSTRRGRAGVTLRSPWAQVRGSIRLSIRVDWCCLWYGSGGGCAYRDC